MSARFWKAACAERVIRYESRCSSSNAVSGFHICRQTYDRNLTDILKLQADVATSVARQLEVKLVGDETAKIELGGTKNPKPTMPICAVSN